jgi:hypothetical protein
MARTVEIKARIASVEVLVPKATAIADKGNVERENRQQIVISLRVQY